MKSIPFLYRSYTDNSPLPIPTPHHIHRAHGYDLILMGQSNSGILPLSLSGPSLSWNVGGT